MPLTLLKISFPSFTSTVKRWAGLGLFLPSLTFKQFFVPQIFTPEVILDDNTPQYMWNKMYIILLLPCEDEIRVTVNGVSEGSAAVW